jgi:hypothetical protein
VKYEESEDEGPVSDFVPTPKKVEVKEETGDLIDL